MEKHKNQLRALIQLAMSDQTFDQEEKAQIYSIAVANNLGKEVVDELVEENILKKGSVDIDFGSLTFDERFDFLYNVIQLMKIDSEVFLSEIKYCEKIAQNLGFDKKVVKALSSRIYSDPSITADRARLMRETKNFEL
ncbi:MAG: TerB family tellurite resistance protein [Cyclobacteriaceae bacterium]